MHAGVCARGGVWQGHKIGDIKWNGDLVKISAKQLLKAFNKLDDELLGIRKDLSHEMQGLFEGLCTKIRDSEDAQGSTLEPFFDFVNGVARDIVEEMVSKFKDNLMPAIAHMRYAATLDTEKSYFASAMEETFKQVTLLTARNHLPVSPPAPINNGGGRKRRVKKPTVTAARISKISEKLRGEAEEPSVFLSVGRLCEDDLTAIMNAWEVECNSKTKAGYEKIIGDFTRRFQENEVKEEENPAAVEKLTKAVEEAMEIVQGQMMQQIALSEADAKGGS
jgi:hypothetical protein